MFTSCKDHVSYAKRRKEKINLLTLCIQIQNPYFLERLFAGACNNCLWKHFPAFSLSFRRDKLSSDARRKLEKFVNHDSFKSFFPCSPRHPAWVYALIICLPVGRHPGHRRESRGEWYSFGISFFPAVEGSCLSFGNDVSGTRGDTHGICSRHCDRLGEQWFTWYHGHRVKMSKKSAKKMD